MNTLNNLRKLKSDLWDMLSEVNRIVTEHERSLVSKDPEVRTTLTGVQEALTYEILPSKEPLTVHFVVLGWDSMAEPGTRAKGVWAECQELPGCTTEPADGTLESLIESIQEAFELYVESPSYAEYRGARVVVLFEVGPS